MVFVRVDETARAVERQRGDDRDGSGGGRRSVCNVCRAPSRDGRKIRRKKNTNYLCTDVGNTLERPYVLKRPSIMRSVVQKHVFKKKFLFKRVCVFFYITRIELSLFLYQFTHSLFLSKGRGQRYTVSCRSNNSNCYVLVQLLSQNYNTST